MKSQELWCEAGQHDWVRQAKQGKKPLSCPEHTVKKVAAPKPKKNKINGLEKARAAKISKKAQEEIEWGKKVEEVINHPRMKHLGGPYTTDARKTTPDKLRYIQNQLQNNRANRSPKDLADLEKMREIIMADPFNTSGHMY